MPKPNTAALDADKAAALLASAAQVEQAKANHADDKHGFMVIARQLGEQAARGAGSLTLTARRFGILCGDVDSAVNDAMADEFYVGFAEAFNANRTQGVDALPIASADDRKAAVSTFRTFGKVGPAQMGDTLWEQVLTVRKSMDPASLAVKSAYNALVRVNRQVIDFCAKQKLTTGQVVERVRAEFSDERVKAILTAEVKPEKSAHEILAQAFKQFATVAGSKAWQGSCLGEVMAEVEQFVTMTVARNGKAPADRAEVIAMLAKIANA